jgi:hypothetical protein
MSGLSANTYSWGGDGSLFARGGDFGALGAAPGLGAFEKNLRIPSFLVNCRSLSSSEGTEESADDSLSDILARLLRCGQLGCLVRRRSKLKVPSGLSATSTIRLFLLDYARALGDETKCWPLSCQPLSLCRESFNLLTPEPFLNVQESPLPARDPRPSSFVSFAHSPILLRHGTPTSLQGTFRMCRFNSIQSLIGIPPKLCSFYQIGNTDFLEV